MSDATTHRCSSGIEGFDDVFCGGLPRGCFYLIQGDPGSGKTTLALQFLLDGRQRGESGFYITLSETKKELLQVAESHGWSLDGIPLIELSAIDSLLRPESQNTVFHPADVELTKVSKLLIDEANKVKPSRVVFDSLSEFRLMAESPLRYRRQLLALKQEFARFDSTVLLLDDKMGSGGNNGDPHVLSIAHGVVQMEQLSPEYGSSRRRLQVQKLRGVKFREGYHDYVIVQGGLRVFPRLIAAEHHSAYEHAPVSSGSPELDQLFGGGLDRGTTTLILGPAGTGKSTMAAQYAAQMASRGERSLFFAFDETRDLMLRRSSGMGLNLDKYLEKGIVSVQQVDPAEISPGEFTSRILAGVKEGCKLVVIDSLNGYLNAMPGEKYLLNQLHELCAFLNQQGVLTILIMAQHGLVSAMEAPVDLSYLADTVVSIRFFEALGEVKLALAVMKKRSGQHEKTIRELRLEAGKGIRIGEPLREFHGVLSGSPVYFGGDGRIMKGADVVQ